MWFLTFDLPDELALWKRWLGANAESWLPVLALGVVGAIFAWLGVPWAAVVELVVHVLEITLLRLGAVVALVTTMIAGGLLVYLLADVRARRTRRRVVPTIAGGQATTPYALYLRPFDTDPDFATVRYAGDPFGGIAEMITGERGDGAPAAIRHPLLAELRIKAGDLSIVGLAHGDLEPGGGLVTLRSSGRWQTNVLELARQASLIIYLPLFTAHTRDELLLLRENGLLYKTCLLMPPLERSFDPHGTSARWEAMRAALKPMIVLPARRRGGGLVLPSATADYRRMIPWSKLDRTRFNRLLAGIELDQLTE